MTFQEKDLPFFFFFVSDFRDVLRLAVLSWFTAELVEWRKTVSSGIAFGVFSLLCSSFKLPSHDLASRSYHFIFGLGLMVTKINIESLSEIWIRQFYKTASWPLFNFTFFSPPSVETLKGADELPSLSLLPPLWGACLMFASWLCRGENPLMRHLT